jgi:uncharacterized protein
MNPFYFGSGDRRLFGIYDPGQGGGSRAVLLCHPWGQEYLRAHRCLRHLATLLARQGVHVLRFDYHGTGDSAGDGADEDLAGWEQDLETAIDELKDTSGALRVGLVGLRLGATLAASVAARRPDDVDALALWDPVVRGDEYLSELDRVAGEDSRPKADGEREVLGFVLTARMAAAVRSLDLLALVPSLPSRTRVVVTDPLPSHAALDAALAGRALDAVERMPSAPAWYEDRSSGVGAMPVTVLQRLAGWWGYGR